MAPAPINCSKTYIAPLRPFESERLDFELRLVGEYGLRNKREIWCIDFILSKIRSKARELLKLDARNKRRIFEGDAILKRLKDIGVIAADDNKLDSVLSLSHKSLLDRRLQTVVYRTGLAKSVHHARVLIRQGHIQVRSQVVNVPSFVVRLDSQRHISFAANSPYGGGRPGRVARKKIAMAASRKAEAGNDDVDSEDDE